MTTKEIKYGSKIVGKVFFIKQLDVLGINKKYTGYFELIEILNILINERKDRVISFSREVYPIVASRFNVAEYTIERNIRNLIDKCWSLDLMMHLNIYRPVDQKPKCQDFIYMIKGFLENQIL